MPDGTLGTASEPVRWHFNLVEYEDVTDPSHREWGTAVGLMTNAAFVHDLGGPCADPANGTTFDCSVQMETFTSGLCAGEEFAEQRRGGIACTTFMIGPDRFMTNAHCMTDLASPHGTPETECAGRSVVLRWRTSTPGFPNGNPTILDRHIYRCAQVLGHGDLTVNPSDANPEKNDWVVFRVDRPVSGGTSTGGPLSDAREPLFPSAVAVEPSTGNLIFSHSGGLPLKLDALAEITAPTDKTFFLRADQWEGSSGAPILSPQGRLLGLMVAGPGNAVEHLADGGTCERHCVPVELGDPQCPGFSGEHRVTAVALSQVPKRWLATSLDYDLDGAADDFATFHREGGTLWLTFYVDGQEPVRFDTTFAVDEGTADEHTLLPAGDFNRDGVLDLFLVGGTGGIFVDGQSLVADYYPLLAGTYVDFTVADSNGDGFTDLELVRKDGRHDLYFTGGQPLPEGTSYSGFPTAATGDAKYVTVTGPGLNTVVQERLSFFLGVPGGQSAFDVQIYDGDMGVSALTNDVAAGAEDVCCFELWDDRNKSFGSLSPVPFARRAASELADHGWSTLFAGSVSSLARVDPGNPASPANYRLDVFLARGNCDAPQSNTARVLNAFKVRATADVSVHQGNFSFLAPSADAIFGGAVFDQHFDFHFPVPSSSTEILLRDADADVSVDAEPGATPRGPADLRADGVAMGASPFVGYELIAPDGTVHFLNDNPSGNNDGAPPVEDVEELAFPIGAGHTGSWTWRWHGVLPDNNIHIWVPEGSPVTFELYAHPTARLSPSSARLAQIWSASPALLAGQLPIALGEAGPCRRGSSLRVATVNRALRVLSLAQGARVLPLPLRALRAALLTAKLNLAYADSIGEPLRDAHLYGKDLMVVDLVAEADAALAATCRLGVCLPRDLGAPCAQPSLAELWQATCQQPAWSELSALTRLLSAMNRGEVSFLAGAAARVGSAIQGAGPGPSPASACRGEAAPWPACGL